MDLIEKAKGFLSEPTRAFETSKEEPLEEAVKYYLFIWGALLHVFTYMLGGRWHISRSIKVAMYSSTPLIVLGWIPILGIFGWIWVGALNVVGLHQYQDLPEGKAILIIIVSVIIPMAITGF